MKKTVLSEIELSSGELIKKGSRIRLVDKVGEKYMRTKQWNLSIENPIDICQYDDFDFQFIDIYSTNDGYIKVHKLLSLFEDELQYFKYENGLAFGYTRHLKIEIEKAIQSKEIEIIKESIGTMSGQQEEIRLLEEVKELVENYTMGLLTKEERDWPLRDKYLAYFQHIQQKWKINHYVSITGEWHQKT